MRREEILFAAQHPEAPHPIITKSKLSLKLAITQRKEEGRGEKSPNELVLTNVF